MLRETISYSYDTPLAADGSAAQAPTYEQLLKEQCDLGLRVVDIDDYLDEIMDGVNWHVCHGLDFWPSTT